MKLKNSSRTIFKPLQSEQDYEAVLGRIELLEHANEELIDEDELDYLEQLAENYEERETCCQEDGDDFGVKYRIPEAETVNLATFKLSNGNEIQFLGIPELDEMMIGETADAGSEDFLLNPEMSPIQIFLKFAPKDCAVPHMLSKLDSLNLLKDRSIVDKIDKPIKVSLVDVGITAAPIAAMGGGSCQPGPAGANFFLNHHCNTLGGPGYGPSESHCYAGSYNWIEKRSNKRRRTTYARMASCGSGMNRMRHFYRTSSGYHTQVNIFVDPHKVVHWWSAKKGVRRYRRVRFEAHEPGGWVRGWVKYHNQIAGGWF